MAVKKTFRPYNSLEEIQLRKKQLREVIQLEDQEVKRLWGVLTTSDGRASRSEQISAFISYGMMAYEGVVTLRKLKKQYGSLVNIFRRHR